MSLRRFAITLAVAAAAVAAALAVGAGGAVGSHRVATADPIVGTWIGVGGQYRNRLHTIVESGGAIEVRAAESYTFPEAASCAISSGQVLGRLTFVGTSSEGYRRYQGQWIGWVVSGSACTVGSPEGQWTAELRPGEDAFQTPPLPNGPNNVLSLYGGAFGTGPLPASANFGFNRKSRASGGAGPAKADTEPPRVKALPSTGRRGTKVQLRYTVSDNSGVTSETVTIYRGGKVLASRTLKFSPSKTGKVYAVGWQAPPTVTGVLRFCVQSRDRAGNKSPVSCASLTLR